MTMKKQPRQQQEGGFAIVMTIAILTGMLVLIVPLVLMNNEKLIETDVLSDEIRAKYGKQNARSMLEYLAKRGGQGSKPLYMKNAILPGWQNIPIRLKHKSGKGNNVTQFSVYNIMPAFLMMATGLSEVNSNFGKTGTASISDPSQFMTNTYMIIGKEVILGSSRGANGISMATPHRTGDIVYGIPPNVYSEAAIRVQGQWSTISSWECSSSTPYEGTFTIHSPVNIQSGPNQDVIVEFYPFKPFGDSINYSAELSIRITDENSKINLNSITKSLASALGITMKDELTGDMYPFHAAESILAVDNLSQAELANIMPLVTTYSEPDYSMIGRADIYQGTNPSVPNKVLRTNGSSSASYTAATQKIYQHHVNFNTASVVTMAKVLSAMNASKPYEMARKINEYRSGDTGSTEIVDYFDGDENPFDGYSGSTTYHSAEEEFLSWVNTNYASDYSRVKAHVYANGDLEGYSALANPSAPIGFEAGAVKTAQITSGVIRKGRATAVQKETMVFRDNFDIEDSGSHKIILDSEHGWNLSASTLKDVDWRPVSIADHDAGSTPKTVSFSHSTKPIPPSLMGLIGSERLHPKYVSGNNSGLGMMEVVYFDDSSITTPDLTGYPVDFGIHLKAQPWDHLFDDADPNTPADPFNDYLGATPETEEGMEPYIYAATASPIDDFCVYETVLFRKNATWTQVDWEIAESGGPVRISVNGGAYEDGSGQSIIANVQTYSKTVGVTKDFLSLKFSLSKYPETTIARDSLPATEPKTEVENKILWACPQLFRVTVTYTKDAKESLITVYDVR